MLTSVPGVKPPVWYFSSHTAATPIMLFAHPAEKRPPNAKDASNNTHKSQNAELAAPVLCLSNKERSKGDLQHP